MIHILISFIAGILTVLAPCILLPLPIIFGGSVGQRSRTRPIFIAVGFVVSFATLALAINFLVTSLGLSPNVLRSVAVVMLVIFSVFMIWPTPFELLMSKMSGVINKAGRASQETGNGNLGGFMLGVIIGVIWAPCAGPILGAILTLVALQTNISYASSLLVAYSVGAGVPMLLIAYGGQILTTKVKSIARYSHQLQQVFGVILVLLAITIYFQYDTLIQAKLVEKFPVLGSGIEELLSKRFITQADGPVARNQGGSVEGFDDHSLSDSSRAMPVQPKKGEKIELKNYGVVPEFTGISQWLNSDPLTMQSLKGKVVLVDFWTYSCINCIRTLPYVTKWYDTYADKGLVVIGVHTPEFAFEKVSDNVATAIKRHGIRYPVAQDNEYATWKAYGNQYWPAEYLIDTNGDVVYAHFGEGKYEHTENIIRQLLGLDSPVSLKSDENLSGVKSPEMYFGTNRLEFLDKTQASHTKSEYVYNYPAGDLKLNTFAMSGSWEFRKDSAVLATGTEGKGGIKLHFSSGKVHMVAGSSQPITLKIIVDGKVQKDVTVSAKDLYTLFNSEDYTGHVLEIQVPSQTNLEVFTFTFG